MKRKMLILFCLCFAVICCALPLTACTNGDDSKNPDNSKHTCIHEYEEVITQPTCTEQGFTTYTCSKCSDSYIDNYVKSLDHDLQPHEAKEATCTEVGWNAYDTCSQCNYTTYTEILALNHDLQQHEAKEPTSTEVGWNAYETCSRCNYTTYTEIPALNHETPIEKVEGTAGLEYTLSDDGEYYYLSGLGSAKDNEEIVIANYYNGKPVKQIGKYAVTTYEEAINSGLDNLTEEEFMKLFIFKDSKVKRITVSEGITTIGAFAFIWDLQESSIIENFSLPNSLSFIGYGAFYFCSSLTSITIPDSVTSIGEEAFRNCSSLTSITISDSVTYIGRYAFYRCSSLTSVTIGNSVTSIGEDAFSNCSKLTSVTIGNSVTSIGVEAFSRCSSLTSVTIPDSVTSIGDCAFAYCSSLTGITIPDSVTYIGNWAFEYCSSLTSVTIGNSVTYIGNWAFEYCSSLTDINFTGTKAQWSAISKGDNWDGNTGNYTIHWTNRDIEKEI